MLGSVLRESGPIKRKQSTGRPRILPRLAPADKKRAKEKKKIYTHKRETVVLFHNPQLEMYIILYVYKKKEAAAAAGALAARLSSVNTLATVYSKTLYNRRRLMTLWKSLKLIKMGTKKKKETSRRFHKREKHAPVLLLLAAY